MTTQAFAVIALFILGFGLISGRIEKSILTPPMTFVIFGLMVSPGVLGLVDLRLESELVKILTELTLVLVLFTDASRIDLKLLRREHNIPVRLLGVGLPLTIIFGAIAAAILFANLTFWEAAVLATILAPTDAALGQAVISSPRVPVRIRQALNVESGLNDGLCLPILLILLSVAGMAAGTETAAFWLNFAAKQVILGPIVGVAVGYVGGQLVSLGSRTEWMNVSFRDLSALSLSLLAYSLAELVGGNGFIAAFCAGLTLGNAAREICPCLYEFGEAEGQLLVLLTFMVYGSIMVLPVLDALNWQILLHALLSLTVVRMAGVALSLQGLHLQLDTLLFLGWFGPRGVASIIYGLIVLERTDITAREPLFAAMSITVLISVFAHGVSAFPGAQWYAARLEKMREMPDVMEHAPVKEMPTRFPSRLESSES